MREINEKKYSEMQLSEIVGLARGDQQAFVNKSEDYYNAQVMAAAQKIAANRHIKFVLLCGPSASGKTTTAHKLKHRLISLGVGARVVSMDNFFLGMEHYPTLPSGKPDMESFLAVDLQMLNSCFAALLQNGKALFPEFDFIQQRRVPESHRMALGENDVLIMEGIHALNPQVLSNIAHENLFRIYVSVRTQVLDGDETVLVPKDIRLMRRMVRDHHFRNYPPLETLENWANVVAGERENIDPYRDQVDLKMDNTIDYEVCVWRGLLLGLLSEFLPVVFGSYPGIQRLFAGLERFPEINPALIPQNSLLREFVGKTV